MKFLKFLLILFKAHIDLPCGHAQIKKKNKQTNKKKNLIIKQEGNRGEKNTGETCKQPKEERRLGTSFNFFPIPSNNPKLYLFPQASANLYLQCMMVTWKDGELDPQAV